MTRNQIISYIITLVIGVVVGICVISATQTQFDTAPYEHEIKTLKTLIDTNNAHINQLNIKATFWETQAKKQDSIIDTQQTKIEKLNKDAKEKINAVDRMSSIELYNSITNRYKNR